MCDEKDQGIPKKTNLAALPDEVRQIIIEAFTLIAARTCNPRKLIVISEYASR